MIQTERQLSTAEKVLSAQDLEERVYNARLLAQQRELKAALKTVTALVEDRSWYANTDPETINERAELFARALIVLITRLDTPHRIAVLRRGMMSEETLKLYEAIGVVRRSLERITGVNGEGRLVYIEDVYGPDVEFNPEVDESDNYYSSELVKTFSDEWPKLEADAVRYLGIAINNVMIAAIEDAGVTGPVWKKFRTATMAYLFALDPSRSF